MKDGVTLSPSYSRRKLVRCVESFCDFIKRLTQRKTIRLLIPGSDQYLQRTCVHVGLCTTCMYFNRSYDNAFVKRQKFAKSYPLHHKNGNKLLKMRKQKMLKTFKTCEKHSSTTMQKQATYLKHYLNVDADA